MSVRSVDPDLVADPSLIAREKAMAIRPKAPSPCALTRGILPYVNLDSLDKSGLH